MKKYGVGFLGANGKMGQTIVPILKQSDKFAFTAGVSKKTEREQILASDTDICIDFTTPSAVLDNVMFLLDNDIHAVVGTTGLSEQNLTTIRNKLLSKPNLGVIVAPNFAIGAVLTTFLSSKAAKFFSTVEIVEGHNSLKVDSPSGTALATAAAIAKHNEIATPPNFPVGEVNGSRGKLVNNVPIHSLRSTGMVAHERVIFGNPGEVFTISHDSLDRKSFWPGIKLALEKVVDNPGLTLGIDKFLDLE